MEHNKERCRRICGDEIRDCFMGNKRQLDCIADMVVNKISNTKGFIESAMGNDPKGKLARNLDSAVISLNELLNWVKFLQISHDLKGLSLLSSRAATPERRKEVRYAVAKNYSSLLSVHINLSDSKVAVTLTDFSQRGMQFISPSALEMDSTVDGTLSSAGPRGKKVVTFKLRIRHCIKDEQRYIVGGRILEIFDASTFNFFENIFDFISQIKEDLGDR